MFIRVEILNCVLVSVLPNRCVQVWNQARQHLCRLISEQFVQCFAQSRSILALVGAGEALMDAGGRYNPDSFVPIIRKLQVAVIEAEWLQARAWILRSHGYQDLLFRFFIVVQILSRGTRQVLLRCDILLQQMEMLSVDQAQCRQIVHCVLAALIAFVNTCHSIEI